VTGGPQIEVGVADAADHGLLARQLGDQPLGQLEAVHHLRVAGADRRDFHRHGAAHCLKTLPPVSSGERMRQTGTRVAAACLIERSTMNSSSSSRVMVWLSTASASSTGRMV